MEEDPRKPVPEKVDGVSEPAPARFHLAAIVDSADDAIISKDLNSRVKSWNDAAHRLFGYTQEEIIGESILCVIPEELHHQEDEILRRLRAGERIQHYETTRVRKSGQRIEVSITISPIRDELDRVIGASTIVRDISDRKRMERLLVQTEKLAATGRMAASIAHEINNPLESLMNLVFLARQNSHEQSKAHRYLLTAEGELERLSHIARQMLGYYRDTGSPVAVHLQEVIETVLAVYRSKLLASGVAVDTEFHDVEKIVVSKGEMIQVFSNLITNAVDAMREGGVLHLSVHKVTGPGRVGIQGVVRDQGTGIQQEDLDRIFEPFFTTKGTLGTGIGLWVAKQLVEKRGGEISISSTTEAENSGTCATVFLPFIQPSDISHRGN